MADKDETPKAVGRYLIERLLGRGAMGAVYLAKDPDLGRLVAIKTVRDLDLDPPTVARYIQRFKNEARAAGRLFHPAIVHVYDVGEDAAVGPFLVFEYIPGASLRELLHASGPLSPKRVAELALHIGGALDVAHAAGIIHRDIKPDNLLVGEDGRIKLADFGIARVPDAALTKDGQFLGTPCYAAPETLRTGTYGPRSDVFSFAAVLYEVITGIRAFPGDDAVAVAHKVAHDEPARPSLMAKGVSIPAGVDRVVMKGLSKDANLRYASAGELATALITAMAEANLVDAAGLPPARARSPLPRWAGFAAIVTIGVGVGVAAVLALGLPGLGLGEDADAVPDAGVPVVIGTHKKQAPTTVIDPGSTTTAIAEAGVPNAVDGGGPHAGMGKYEREEAAKDAVSDAEGRLDTGDWGGAAKAIARARSLDPSNNDIDRVENRLRKEAPPPEAPLP